MTPSYSKSYEFSFWSVQTKTTNGIFKNLHSGVHVQKPAFLVAKNAVYAYAEKKIPEKKIPDRNGYVWTRPNTKHWESNR